ncbi:MAG TPA: hypothetical protein VD772_05560, partial [Anseongella sp.]|nr:hypothetical protein [Anseongella sp.]
MEKRTLHFNLAHLNNPEGLVVHANFQDYDLKRHTPATLAQARQEAGLLRHVPDAHLTHYLEGLGLPASRPALIAVSAPETTGNGGEGRIMVALKIHLPAAGRRAAAERIRAEADPDDEPGEMHPKLRKLGVAPALLQSGEATALADMLDALVTEMDTAEALLFKHPNLLNLNEDNGGEVPAYIVQKCIRKAIDRDGGILRETIEDLGKKWCTLQPVLDEDGRQMTDPDKPGELLFTQQLHKDVEAAMRGPLQMAVKLAQQPEFLRNQQWTVEPGTTSGGYQGRPVSAGEKPALKEGFKWTLNNLTPSSGLTIDPAVRYSSTRAWTGNDLWTARPESGAPFTRELAEAALHGELFVKVTTPQHPEGVAGGPVLPTDQSRGNTRLSAKLEKMGSYEGAAGTVSFILDSFRGSLVTEFRATGLENGAKAALYRT